MSFALMFHPEDDGEHLTHYNPNHHPYQVHPDIAYQRAAT